MVAATSEPYSLLITDDDDALRDSLRMIFEPKGFNTYLAGSGHEAVRVIEGKRIHIVIVDMQMPDLTGLETIALIRSKLRKAIPYILMSGDPSQELRQKALEAEAYSFLPKPLDVFGMRKLVDEIIRRYYS